MFNRDFFLGKKKRIHISRYTVPITLFGITRLHTRVHMSLYLTSRAEKIKIQ